MQQIDVVVIGSGNAGQAAVGAARADGRSVVVVERAELGGTCAIRGCVPKKVLVAAAETLDTIRRAGAHGVRVAEPTVDWTALTARLRGFVSSVPGDVARSLEGRGVEVVAGAARFVGPLTVSAAGRTFAAGAVVIAAGSVPRSLPIPGAEGLSTSDHLFTLSALPRSVVFVGGGVIAFEFAHVFARMGVKVTILEVTPRALGPLDEALADRVLGMTRALGVEVHTGVRVDRIEGTPAGVVVHARHHDAELVVEAGLGVNAAGRVPALSDLDLAVGGILTDDRGLPVLDGRQRSVSDIRVAFAGDALPGTPQLSPVASVEGRRAWAAIAGHDLPELEPETLPSAVYTIPGAAMVGRTVAQAARAGLDVDVRDNDTSGWRSTRTYADDVGFSRVVVERGTERIIGAHLLGRAAPEVIHSFAMAMAAGLRAPDLKRFVTAYPTFHADVKYLL